MGFSKKAYLLIKVTPRVPFEKVIYFRSFFINFLLKLSINRVITKKKNVVSNCKHFDTTLFALHSTKLTVTPIKRSSFKLRLRQNVLQT
jgi:hypothetical protein